ncbi:MAG: phosphate/phosphite/phosphonate ABC transporter substrate-binding protein [Betaproteobacteria bacterium]
MASTLRIAILLMAALLAAIHPAQAQQKPYRFSPVNQWDINRTASYWNPIIQYVSEKSGVPLQLKIGRTSADTTAYVLAQEVEFAFTNHLFSPQRAALGWKVFGRRMAPAPHAQIVVPAESGITSLQQLRDQEVAFAGNEAFIGYKVPLAHLLSLDIPVKALFSGNQNAAFIQMLAGRAKAAGSNSMLVTGFVEREKKSMRVLWSSEEYHDLALMVSPKVPDAEVRAVAAAFLGMHSDPRGSKILEAASKEVSLTVANHFIPASMADYANYVRFFEKAPAFLR